MIRVLIADDHEVVRKGLVQILTDGPETFLIDEAGSGGEALHKAWHNDYDLVLVDIFMPGRGALDMVKELKSLSPKLPVLVISTHPAEQYAVRALRAGASGYLVKGSAVDELPGAMSKVLAGGKYISSSLAEKLAFSVIDGAGKPLHETLSAREYQVMRYLASGKTVRAIADEMSLSMKTINTYRTRLLRKMRLKSNAELTHYAVENNLL